jgi:tRNA (cytidine/uridine-2'-O-)-methyltransferase
VAVSPSTPAPNGIGSPEGDAILHVVLVQPEIPPNTGSIARLCAATGIALHLVAPLGFSLDDRYLKRAGLDYWPLVDLRIHRDWAAFREGRDTLPFAFFSARAKRSYLSIPHARGEYLVFGGETRGLPGEILELNPDRTYSIPIFNPGVRSLNLSNAVAIVAYDALRQLGLLPVR